MPIKFTCPHCKRAFTVKDQFAGKKGACPGCKQIVTIPKADAASVPPRPPTPPQPKTAPAPAAPKVERSAAELEAEAAALFHDEPQQAEPTEVKTIDFACPYCDEQIQLPAELAGKRAPCPECKHIIKVPELVKKDPKDWRKVEARGPSGARLPDQPAPEGAWASTAASAVARKSLEEAGVIPKTAPPRTTWQKVRWPVLGVTTVVLLAGAGWFGYRWWGQRAADRAVKEAIAYAASADAKPTDQAALSLGAGDYYLGSQKSGCIGPAREQYGKAFNTLRSMPEGDDRDPLLIALALSQVELGGNAQEANKELRLAWPDTQKLLLATLTQVKDNEARQDGVRQVSRRLIARGQGGMVLPLVRQVYTAPDADRAAALSLAGLELLREGDKPGAEKAVEEALRIYEGKPRPALRPEVVALAATLQKKPPTAGEEGDDKRNEHLGRVEGLARTDQWDQARQHAASNEYGDEAQFQALLALAAAAVEMKIPDTNDAEAAIKFAEAKLRDRKELSWSLLRLTRVALRASLPEDRVQALINCMPKGSLRGQAQLALLRSQLAQSKQLVEDSAADKVDSASVARRQAAEELARHNTRLNTGWAATVQGWQQPLKAFGSLGIGLGLQDRERR
jgi:hypothetical protein